MSIAGDRWVLTRIALDTGRASGAKWDVVVVKCDRELQESYSPHLLHVWLGEVTDSGDAQGIRGDHEVLQGKEDKSTHDAICVYRLCLGKHGRHSAFITSIRSYNNEFLIKGH